MRGRGKVRSVLLNANPEDTGSQTKRLRLTLGYAANLDKVGTGMGLSFSLCISHRIPHVCVVLCVTPPTNPVVHNATNHQPLLP